MNARQQCRLKMFCTLTAFLAKNHEVTMHFSGLPELIEGLKKIIEEIITTSSTRQEFTRKERSMNARRMEDLFDDAWDTLQLIDLTAEINRYNYPSFFWGYRSARKVFENSNGFLALRGKVIDSSTLRPISSVILHFRQDCNGMEYRRVSAAKGGFRFKELPPGDYMITAKKHGYLERSFSTSVLKEERAELLLTLDKKN